MKKSPLVLRPLKFQKSFLPHAEGSCLVTMGNTKVLCVASIEGKAPPFADEKGTGWLQAEYSMLPRAGQHRGSRQKLTTGGRSQEISRLIGRALRAAVHLEFIQHKTITIDCDVIRADGGTRTAAINGGMVALHQALLFLMRKKEITRWPLRHHVGAISVGIVNKKPFLDLSYKEDVAADTDLNVVMTENKKFVEVQGTAEGKPFSAKELRQMLRLADKGIGHIIRAQKKMCGPQPR